MHVDAGPRSDGANRRISGLTRSAIPGPTNGPGADCLLRHVPPEIERHMNADFPDRGSRMAALYAERGAVAAASAGGCFATATRARGDRVEFRGHADVWSRRAAASAFRATRFSATTAARLLMNPAVPAARRSPPQSFAERLLKRLTYGVPLRAVCRADGMPDRSTVYRRLADPAFDHACRFM